jgi:hypothetical protein
VAKQTDFGNNIAGLRRALRALPKEAKAELTVASREIAGDIASEAQARGFALATSIGGWRYLAPTIRAGGSSVPEVKIGGAKRLPGRKGSRQTVGDLLWGLEFGGGARPRTRQFLPHLGTTGYALWPVVRERSDETGERYGEALSTVLDNIKSS